MTPERLAHIRAVWEQAGQQPSCRSVELEAAAYVFIGELLDEVGKIPEGVFTLAAAARNLCEFIIDDLPDEVEGGKALEVWGEASEQWESLVKSLARHVMPAERYEDYRP